MLLRAGNLRFAAMVALSFGSVGCGLIPGWGSGSGNGAITGHEGEPTPTPTPTPLPPIPCGTQELADAQPFDLFVTGDLNHGTSDVEGRVAVGGSATLFNDSFGAMLSPDASRPDLLVNFHLYFINGSVPNGKAVYGGVASVKKVNSLGGVQQVSSVPLNFPWAGAKLQSLSTFLAGQAMRGDVFLTPHGDRQEVRLVGTDAQVNIFSVPASELAIAHSLRIEAPAGASVLVNVTGPAVSLSNFGLTFAGTDREHTLFNFPDAETLNLDQIGFQGSILAPKAAVTFPNGQLNGQLFAKSFTGYGQLNHHPLVACVPSGVTVPTEPTDPVVTPPVTFPVDTTTDGGIVINPTPDSDAGTPAVDAGTPVDTDGGTVVTPPSDPFVCSTSALRAAQDFDVFVTGNLIQQSTDVEGRIAVGGSADLSYYSVADKIQPDSVRLDLIVGGDLVLRDGSVPNGSVLYGGSGVLERVNTLGTVSQGASPVDFVTAGADLTAYSNYIASQADTGVVQVAYMGSTCSIDLVGIDPTVNYFSVTPYDLFHAHIFRISVPSTSSVIFNVRGTPLGMSNFGIYFTGTTRNNMLFNFPDAYQLTLKNIAVDGTVLAPKADVLFPDGQLNGQLVARSLSGSGQVNHHPFTGCVPTGYDDTIPPAVTYTWQTGAWGVCSLAGAQTRTVTCLASTGETTENALCDADEMPATSAPCTPPVVYDWHAGEWDVCTAAGSQSRVVTCLDSSGAPAADSACSAATKPAATQTCTPETYSWQGGQWSTCSSSGTQTRSVTCLSSSGAPVPAEVCAAMIEAASTQACTPPVTYSWLPGGWEACTAAGSQTRPVSCIDSTGAVADNSHCDAAAMPAGSQSCTPPETFYWVPGQWSNCSMSGSQTRDVTCASSYGSSAAPSSCDAASMPTTTQSCTPPVIYAWQTTAWTECSAGGSQTRTVTCLASTGSVVADTYCDVSTQPAAVQACTPPVVYSWQTTTWSECSMAGSQTRTVTCLASTGSTVANSFCDVTTQPSATQSCTPPVVYSWQTTTWSECSMAGSQTRTITCLASTGSTVANSYCDSTTTPDSTQSCTPPVVYSWQTTTWSVCSAGGSQTRTITCLASTGSTVANSYCDASTLPAATQSCTPPVTYSWTSGNWGTCSGGSQSRAVTCLASTGSTVANSYCDASTKPAATQSCTAPVTYSWTYSSWDECSAGGSQTRTVSCLSSTGATVAESFCTGSKPNATQSCTPPVTYAWTSGNWGTCSSAGSQSRPVTCQASTGATVAESYCGGSKPNTTQSCTPPVTYAWTSGNWGECSSAGSQSRPVTCQASTGATVAESFCGGSKPATTQSCTPPVTYAWTSGNWGTCSSTGSQSRPVTCVASTGATVAESYCGGSKPTTTQSCTPPVTYAWTSGSWGTCSSGGSQTRAVTCLASTGATVAESYCSAATKPAVTQGCTPPVTYSWTSGSWGTCSSSGSQTRLVTCVSSTGATVADSSCTGTKPATSQSCTPPVTYSWQVGSWSSCAHTCTQDRTVTCVASTGATVSSSYCNAATKPVTEQSCTAPVTYAWVSGSWGTCSSSGSQSRTVSCVSSTGDAVSSSSCTGTKPATAQSCTPPVTYSWSAASWGTCSAAGSQTRTVACVASTGATVSNSSCNAATKPAVDQCCTPPVTYAWETSTWGSCSNGSQTRTVTCESSTGATVSSSSCTASTKPATSQTCTSSQPPVGHKNCTYTIGYWKNHCSGSSDAVTPLLQQCVGTQGASKSMPVTKSATASEILSQNVYGSSSNGITKLYAQLLAAKLSIQQGANTSAIASTCASADAFLATHSYRDWDSLSSSDKNKVNDWHDTLDDYNNGRVGPGHCD